MGMGLLIASFLLQAGALGSGELSAVQTVIVLGLPLTLVAAKIGLGAQLDRSEWGSVILLTVGLAGVLGFLHPTGGVLRRAAWPGGWVAGQRQPWSSLPS